MRKLVAILVLLVVSWLIYRQYKKEEDPDLAAVYRYAISDVKQISKIKIDYRLMDPDILLEKENDYWMLNNQFRVRPDAVENLLRAVQTIELQYIPTEAAKKNMIRDLATTGTKVEIYDYQDQLIKSYFIGGNTPDERGTFVIMEGSQSPSVATLKGLEGSLRPYFIMPENEWRDRTVFAEDYNALEEVMVEYIDQPFSSFSIRRQPHGFKVFPVSDRINLSGRIERSGAVESYLQDYKKVSAEAVVNDRALAAQLEEQRPFARITVRKKGAEEYQATFYPLLPDDFEEQKNNIERYHILDNQGNLFLVQHRLFGKLFVDLDNFFSN